jgi:hypothetical protein
MKKARVLDVYFKFPIIWDAVLGVLLAAVLYLGKTRMSVDTKDISGVQNSLAGTAISLAGFILTSLTIIVTLRANLSYKGVEGSSNGLELILNSWAYKKIVNIFKGAIQKLVIVAFVLYAAMLVNKNDAYESVLLALSGASLLSIAFTTLRCLYILFTLVELEIKGREEASKPMARPKRWRVSLGMLPKQQTPPMDLPKEFTVEMLEEEIEEVFRPYN